MSRSYHVNRTARYWLKRGGLDPDEIGQLYDKHLLKRRVRADRKRATTQDALPPLHQFEIRIHDQEPGLYFPATAGELKSVLALLTPDERDGLGSITLALGAEVQERAARQDAFQHPPSRDPVFGRASHELNDGLFTPLVLGTYAHEEAAVMLYGYVVTQPFRVDFEVELGLKIEFLRTFLHELAHHHQYRSVTRRGRLPTRSRDRIEEQAQEFADRWFEERLIPWVRAWVLEHHTDKSAADVS